MPRIPRLLKEDEPTVYHVISRVALDGLPFNSKDKEFLLWLMKKWSSIFFVDVLGFAIMGNHFHLVVRMHTVDGAGDEEVMERYMMMKSKEDHEEDGDDMVYTGPSPGTKEFQALKAKLCSLSWYVKEIKQGFSRYYNRKYDRRGYLWGDRFKSVIVEDGEALLNLLAYVDLNPVRAGIVKRPEDYRWCGLGYYVQSGNRDGFLCAEFGMNEWCELGEDEALARYREYVYEAGGIAKDGKSSISPEILEKERGRGYRLTRQEVFRLRCRYFTDGCIIGSSRFVEEMAERFRDALKFKRKRRGISFMLQGRGTRGASAPVCSLRRPCMAL